MKWQNLFILTSWGERKYGNFNAFLFLCDVLIWVTILFVITINVYFDLR